MLNAQRLACHSSNISDAQFALNPAGGNYLDMCKHFNTSNSGADISDRLHWATIDF